MAGVIAAATTTEQALAAATQETVLQLVAAAEHSVTILGWGVFFDGVSGTAEPVEVVIQRQSTPGTSSANIPKKWNDNNQETLQTTARDGFSSTEPTSGDILDIVQVHPQQGYEVKFPLGQEIVIGGAAALDNRLGIRCTAPATVNVRAKFIFEE